MECLGAVL